ncbi:TAXI family TRAP transporter solute-binding subunit [Alkalihalobacterium alkalinitrilicum]|uniref:TAXI family TRAP transporter solute-binding subunit n=1 Tax=Alkalihalobacterium alkalinitrilicum TaxID=427920 RepID=UPI000994AC7A|nr:TAXI family TRAP transporter solute-binding subunit [Alkalihalobacterium alkalinitrilicum]
MKKNSSFVSLALKMFAIVMMLVIVGCNSSNTSQSEGDTSSSTEAPAQSPGPIELKVASNNTQTSWYQFSVALSEVLKGSSPAMNVEVLPLAGGTGNVQILDQGEADFAVLFNVTSKWAMDGTVAYEEKYEDLRGIAGGLNDYFIGIIARADFLESNNIESISDIKEQEIPVRVITNPVGTLAEYSTRLTLEAYGLDYDMVESFGGNVELTSNDVIKSAFQNGQADLHILAMSKGHPVITEMALSTDLTVMAMEDEILNYLGEYGFSNSVFPADEFNGQDYDVNTAGMLAGYVTHKDLDEEIAYAITKAIIENKEALVNGHSSVADFDPSQAGNEEVIGVPLHPGAQRYYEEAGLLE